MRFFKILIGTPVMVLVLANQLYPANKAVFLHGFGADSTAWTISGTPEDLMNPNVGVLDSYLNITYDLNQLAQPDGLNMILNGIIDRINTNNNPGDKWIIVGHSLGGLLTRGLEGEILYQNAIGQTNINLKGVLTLGTPHQGARPAFAIDGQPGSEPYYNARAMLDNFIWDISYPLDSDYTGNLPFVSQAIQAMFGWLGTELLIWTANTGLTDNLFQLDDLIESGYTEGLNYLRLSMQANAGQLIGSRNGVTGSVIQTLNSTATVTAKRSVIGAEKSPTIIRWLSEFEDMTGNANEVQTMEQYNGTKDFYATNKSIWETIEDGSHFICTRVVYRYYFIVFLGYDPCVIEDLVDGKSDKWGIGLAAWENLDSRWGEMIDSYVTETRTGYQRVFDCGGIEPWEQWSAMLNGECWVSVPYTYTVLVPTKNDALLGPQYCLWNSNDIWDPNNTTNMNNQGNYYYSDAGTDGGYNHSELRRYKRGYTLPGVFNEGDVAEPMGEGADWMIIQYGAP